MLMPESFSTVKQPKDSMFCGAAVAAMATGEELAYALRCLPFQWSQKEKKHFIKTRSILTYLGNHGIYSGILITQENSDEDLSLLEPDDSFTLVVEMSLPAIVTVHSETRKDWTHYVFWDGSVVRDPNPDVPDERKLSEFKVLDMMFLTYLEEIGY
jgi:hypothetical protein